jgi:hypothetical protein
VKPQRFRRQLLLFMVCAFLAILLLFIFHESVNVMDDSPRSVDTRMDSLLRRSGQPAREVIRRIGDSAGNEDEIERLEKEMELTQSKIRSVLFFIYKFFNFLC